MFIWKQISTKIATIATWYVESAVDVGNDYIPYHITEHAYRIDTHENRDSSENCDNINVIYMQYLVQIWWSRNENDSRTGFPL